jgi:hypothetical protein
VRHVVALCIESSKAWSQPEKRLRQNDAETSKMPQVTLAFFTGAGAALTKTTLSFLLL